MEDSSEEEQADDEYLDSGPRISNEEPQELSMIGNQTSHIPAELTNPLPDPLGRHRSKEESKLSVSAISKLGSEDRYQYWNEENKSPSKEGSPKAWNSIISQKRPQVFDEVATKEYLGKNVTLPSILTLLLDIAEMRCEESMLDTIKSRKHNGKYEIDSIQESKFKLVDMVVVNHLRVWTTSMNL